MAFDGEEIQDQKLKDLLILSETRNLIERNGWCQRSGKNDSGEYCIIGALVKTLDETDGIRAINVEQYDRLIIQHLHFDGALHVMQWNDDPARSKEQVLARFDAALACS